MIDASRDYSYRDTSIYMSSTVQDLQVFQQMLAISGMPDLTSDIIKQNNLI
jgi:hypothetical protein